MRDLKCLLLKKVPLRSKIEIAVGLLQKKCPNVTINEDALFDEVTLLNEFVTGKLCEWNDTTTTIIVCGRWDEVIKHFWESSVPHVNIKKTGRTDPVPAWQ